MEQHSSHFTSAAPSTDEWVVTRTGLGSDEGNVVARSVSVMLVSETYKGRELDPVPYFPRADVSAELVGPSDHSTTCPVKGAASYYAIAGDDETADGIWSYLDPISPLEPITGYVAFYDDRFSVAAVDR